MLHANELGAREKLLNRPEAAKFLTDYGYRISKRTLASYASRGNGPKYVLFGRRALYAPSDLLSWADGMTTFPR